MNAFTIVLQHFLQLKE